MRGTKYLSEIMENYKKDLEKALIKYFNDIK